MGTSLFSVWLEEWWWNRICRCWWSFRHLFRWGPHVVLSGSPSSSFHHRLCHGVCPDNGMDSAQSSTSPSTTPDRLSCPRPELYPSQPWPQMDFVLVWISLATRVTSPWASAAEAPPGGTRLAAGKRRRGQATWWCGQPTLCERLRIEGLEKSRVQRDGEEMAAEGDAAIPQFMRDNRGRHLRGIFPPGDRTIILPLSRKKVSN